MKKFTFIVIASALMALTSCTENHSNGERIGVITQFSENGLFFKSWEGCLNTTGMNNSVRFKFSIDNNNPDPIVIATLDSAAQFLILVVVSEIFSRFWLKN